MSSNIMKATRIFLLRHPHIKNAGKIPYKDTPISEHGFKQIEILKSAFDTIKIDFIYSSDLIRCIKFAEILSEVTKTKIIFKKELREVDQGIFCGYSFEEIQKNWPNELKSRIQDFINFCPPKGESIAQACVRINSFLKEIKTLPIGSKLIIITHGAVIRIMIALMLNIPLSNIFSIEQNYCALNIIDLFSDNTWVIKLLNYSANNSTCINNLIKSLK